MKKIILLFLLSLPALLPAQTSVNAWTNRPSTTQPLPSDTFIIGRTNGARTNLLLRADDLLNWAKTNTVLGLARGFSVGTNLTLITSTNADGTENYSLGGLTTAQINALLGIAIIPSAQLSGTISDARLGGNVATNVMYYAGTTAYVSNNVAYVGTNNFSGGAPTTDASLLTSGTLNPLRLSFSTNLLVTPAGGTNLTATFVTNGDGTVVMTLNGITTGQLNTLLGLATIPAAQISGTLPPGAVAGVVTNGGGLGLHLIATGVGINPTNAVSLVTSNATDAVNGTQQYAPAIIMTGHGYATTPAVSVPYSWRMSSDIAQATTPTLFAGNFYLGYQFTNGGAFTPKMTLATGGGVTFAGEVAGSALVSTLFKGSASGLTGPTIGTAVTPTFTIIVTNLNSGALFNNLTNGISVMSQTGVNITNSFRSYSGTLTNWTLFDFNGTMTYGCTNVADGGVVLHNAMP